MLRNNQPINKHTAPLSGEIVSTSVGVIKAVGRYGEKYSVGKIEYQLFSEAGYQYVISPYWDVVDGTSAKTLLPCQQTASVYFNEKPV